MAALIEFLCTAQHDGRGDSSVTLEQGAWAYCPAGVTEGHHWSRIDPTAIEKLRAHASERVRLVVDETTASR